MSRRRSPLLSIVAIALTAMLALPMLLSSAFLSLRTAKAETAAETTTYTVNGCEMTFDSETGDLVALSIPRQGSGTMDTLSFNGAYIDFCYDHSQSPDVMEGTYLRGTMKYMVMDNLITGDLPNDFPYNRKDARRFPQDVTIRQIEGGVETIYTMAPWDGAEERFEVRTLYVINEEGVLEMSATLKNLSDKEIAIQGIASVITGLSSGEGTLVEIPSNLPYGVYDVAGLPEGYTLKGDYSTPLIHVMDENRDVNLIFANPMEKWVPAVVMGGDGKMDIINLACAIDRLAPGESITLEAQYIQLTEKDAGYEGARALYSSKGWEAPTDGVLGALIYSGHPAGVSDNDFQNAEGTLDAYAKYLPKIADLGFDTLWMLPVFEHPRSGGSVYLPFNLEYIDSRYSARAQAAATPEEARQAALEEMADFGKAATEAGVRLIIDYIPHGPSLVNGNTPIYFENPWLTEERIDWISRQRWPELDESPLEGMRSEWNCFALDFANPDYLNYIFELVKKQAVDFSAEGSRIDAVMGSVPNWEPLEGHRASQTGLYGGKEMTKAIREGIIAAGKTPLIFPENNQLSPYFAEVTDLFHGMPFYRFTLALRQAEVSQRDFAASIAHWLRSERESAPKGLQFGRFLANHDTVAPWYYPYFDGKRPSLVYGTEGVRAMWTLLATIDGSLIIYENDEIGHEAFFAELLSMRREQFGQDNAMAIEYLNDASSGIIAYRRYDDNVQKLVLVNLTNETASRDLSGFAPGGIRFSTAEKSIAYGEALIDGDTVTLAPYKSMVITLAGGDAYSPETSPAPYLITNIKAEIEAQISQYQQVNSSYQGFEVTPPIFTPSLEDAARDTFDPVEEFSRENTDGPVWKYMFVDAMEGPDMHYLSDISNGTLDVWRVGNYKGGFKWAGAGRSTDHYPPSPYFELNSDLGSKLYGMLVFVAPKDGTYTIPSFEVFGTEQGSTSMLVILQNGKIAYVSDMLTHEEDGVTIPDLQFSLKAGDSLSFYMERLDGGYVFVQLNGMQVKYAGE